MNAVTSATLQAVALRVVRLALILGGILAAGMALGAHPLISAFTKDGAVRAASLAVFPIVVLTQPLNALAFVWDGVLYGAGGFSYAAKAMPVCAVPAVAVMLTSLLGHAPDRQLIAIWAGLTLLMLNRSLTIWLPFRQGWAPFDKMAGHHARKRE